MPAVLRIKSRERCVNTCIVRIFYFFTILDYLPDSRLTFHIQSCAA